MFFLDQMKLPGLIGLCLMLIPGSDTEAAGKTWSINVTRWINATQGTDVTIRCTFTYPTEYHTPDVKVYWKKPGRSTLIDDSRDPNPYVYHSDQSYILENYKNKTSLIGNKAEGDCSLQIKGVTENEPRIYVRVIGNGNQYSFKRHFVNISLTDAPPDNSDSEFPDFVPTPGPPNKTKMYTAIFVPVATFLVVLLVVGIVFFIKHKRSRSVARENSGYYANFSRASSNQPKRENFCKQDNKKPPEPKAIDEPVYANVETPPVQMDQSMDSSDRVYANVDYSKY